MRPVDTLVSWGLNLQYPLWTDRTLVWFSCGAASAVAAKVAIKKATLPVEVLYCDTLKYEHPDNIRFMKDVEAWIGREIKILHSDKYEDIFDVFRKRQYIVGHGFAPCTEALKKDVRIAYSTPGDQHVLGLTADEEKRISNFEAQNSQLWVEWVLRDMGITKKECFRILSEAGIELPAMYRLGYRNNNCIGCVKGGAGYWNKIRRDFPEAFEHMAELERELSATICKYRGKRVYLDELPNDVGTYQAEDIECGTLCVREEVYS